MKLIDFYINVIEALNNKNVKYMMVCGQAVIFYGYVRATIDMDLWISENETNLVKLNTALQTLGYSKQSCEEAIKHFKNCHMFKIPGDGFCIDVLDSLIMKSEFKDAYNNHESIVYNNVLIKVIGFNDLLLIKQKSNRTKDLLDAKELKKINL